MILNKPNLIAASVFMLTLSLLLLPGTVSAQTVWMEEWSIATNEPIEYWDSLCFKGVF